MEGREQSTICDNYKSFITRDNRRREDLFEDGVHVNEEGARLFAAISNTIYMLSPELRPNKPNRRGPKWPWGKINHTRRK